MGPSKWRYWFGMERQWCRWRDRFESYVGDRIDGIILWRFLFNLQVPKEEQSCIYLWAPSVPELFSSGLLIVCWLNECHLAGVTETLASLSCGWDLRHLFDRHIVSLAPPGEYVPMTFSWISILDILCPTLPSLGSFLSFLCPYTSTLETWASLL